MGLTATAASEAVSRGHRYADKAKNDALMAQTPMGRWGEPDLTVLHLAVKAANQMIADRLLLPEDADRELKLLLSDVMKEGALPLRSAEVSVQAKQ